MSRTPTTSEPPSPTQNRKTNTLAITPLAPEFFHPLVLEALQDHFASYGPLNRWVPLSSFGRILVVYNNEHDAERAKLESDPVTLQESTDRPEVVLRVYRADRSPLLPDASLPWAFAPEFYLQPPAIEKNFLISPPGSPPVGWEPIKEDPPNATPLADDLIAALQKLKVRGQRNSLEVLIEPEDGAGVGVYVQDCGSDEESDEDAWVYGQPLPSQWKPVATALPPLPMAA